jgi:hypothetical protein
MKIVNLLGGLGNQMFEYAMYLALRQAHPQEEIKVCTRSFGGYGLHNGLEIHRIFGVDLPEATLLDLAKVAYPFFNYKSWQIVNSFLPRRRSMTKGTSQIEFDYSEVLRDGSCYYDGYWQNEKFFAPIKDVILGAFAFPPHTDSRNIQLSNRLQSARAASCHIRMGDYLKDPIMCVCSEDYYKRALDRLIAEKQPELFCIFSDDIQWCRENLSKYLPENSEVVFVDWNKGENSFRDMHLMSQCHYNIIANSSFSWWGAWLNNHDDKLVIAPTKWMNKPIVNDPTPNNWLRI